MAIRSLEDTRKSFLDAGLAEVKERGVGTAVDHIRLADVAQRIGLTPPAAYRIWGGGRAEGEGGQDRFRKDLARYCIEHIGRGVPGSVVTAAMALIDAGATLPELIRICVKLDFDELSRNPGEIAVLMGLLAAAGRDETLAAAAKQTYNEIHAEFAALYDVLLNHYDREMVPPLTSTDMAAVLESLSNGVLLQHSVNPDVIDRSLGDQSGDEQPLARWSLYALAVEGIVERFTRPRASAKPRSPVKAETRNVDGTP